MCSRIAALLALAVLACGESKTSGEPAAPAPGAPATAANPGPRATAPPAPGDPARGAEVYAVNCASCHGPKGDGDGPAAAALNPKPAKHSDGNYMNALSDEHLFRVIQQGGQAVGKSPLMAAWGATLSEAQIRDVVAFVRTLARPPYRPK